MPEPTWPFNLDDPVRAVHFAIEPDCPYGDPSRCPYEMRAANAVTAYKAWVAAHPSAAAS